MRVFPRIFRYTTSHRRLTMAVADLTLEGVAHDLNNVFQTIAESAELLAADPKWQRLANSLQRSVDRGHRIVFSMLESNRSGTELAPVIEDAVQSCGDYLEYAKRPQIAFTRSIEHQLWLKGAPASWERVFVNLFLNSAQAGAKHIHVQACDGRIIVSDDGGGIPPELLPQIFERRVSTKSAVSGLGLCVVRSIVEQNGGTVTAANGDDGGAVFTIHVD